MRGKLKSNILLFFYLIPFAGPAGLPAQERESSKVQDRRPGRQEVRTDSITENARCDACVEIEASIVSRLEEAAEEETLVLNPESYPSWEECLQENGSVTLFRLRPGDYRSWGTLKLAEKTGLAFTADDFRSIYGPEAGHQHPVNFPVGDQVILENFILFNCSDIALNGLIFSGNNLDPETGLRHGWQNRISDGGHNLINKCFIKDVKRGSGIRIHNSDYNTVLNTVLEQTDPALTGDQVAILIITGEDLESRGNRILNNEIRNWNDGFMLGWNRAKKQKKEGTANHQTGECPATLFAYNHVYLTAEFHSETGEEAYAENGIDLKSGASSDAPEDRIVITRNKIWGFRRTVKRWSSGSAGEAISLHVAASNILITENLIFDVPVGITIFSNPKKFEGASAGNIVVSNNIFSDIKDRGNFHNSGSGVILNTGKVRVQDNVFNAVDRSVDIRKERDSVVVQRNIVRPEKKEDADLTLEISLLKWIDDPAFRAPRKILLDTNE